MIIDLILLLFLVVSALAAVLMKVYLGGVFLLGAGKGILC